MTAYPTFCAASPMKPRHDPSCERRGFSRRPVHKTDRVDPHRTAIPDRNAPTYAASSNLIPIGVSSPKEATSLKGRGYPLRQNQILPRFWGRDMKQFLNFTLPPTGGFHHGGISLWPCSSRRQVTDTGGNQVVANASVGGSRPCTH
jgi:hypothetical protein